MMRLAAVAFALGLMGIPVWLLTREQPTLTAPPAEILPEKNATFHVMLTASAPAFLRVMAANQPTASSDGPAASFQADFEMDAAQPEDLAIFADFTDKTRPHAVRAEIRMGDTLLADSTFWGTGLVEDVLEVPEP
jgi:hypothetical protein